MACSYTYKGVEYTNKQDILNALKTDSVIKSTTPVNKMVYEVNGHIAAAEARKTAIEKYGNDEFMTFVEKDGKIHMVIDEKLLSQQAGNKRLVYDTKGELVEVDVDKLTNDYLSGKSKTLSNSMMDYINLTIAKRLETDMLDQLATSQYEPKEELMDKLMQFANGMGITVTTMEDYISTYEQRNGVPATAEALADMFNKVIALSNKDFNKENFTEEIAHFAVLYYKDQATIQKMLGKVNQTNTYKRYAEQYRQEYGKQYSGEALEQKVREEVLGKLLAEKILSSFNTENSNLNETSIVNLLKNLYDNFLALFKKTDTNNSFFREFGKILDNIANEATNVNGYSKFTPVESKEVYYSLSTQEQALHDRLTQIFDQAKQRYRTLPAKSKAQLRVKEAKLAEINDLIVNQEHLKAILSYIGVISIDLNDSIQTINETERRVQASIDKQLALNPTTYVVPTGSQRDELFLATLGDINLPNLMVFNSNIEQTISELESNLNYLKEVGKIPESQVAVVEKKLTNVRNLVNRVKPTLTKVQRSKSMNLVGESMRKGGATKDIVDKYMGEVGLGIVDELPWWKNILMSYEFAGNPIAGLIFSKVAEAEAMSKIRARKFQQRMFEAAKKANLTKKDTNDLINDGYMIEEIDRRAVEEAYDTEKLKISEEKQAKLEKLTKTSPTYAKDQLQIEDDYKKAVRELDKKYKVQKYSKDFLSKSSERQTENPVTKSKFRTEVAQTLIRDFAAEVNSILKNYNKSTPYSKLDDKDKIRLQRIDSLKAREMSLYDESGAPKEGISLATAYDLLDYYQSGGKEISEAAQKLYNEQNALAKATLKAAEYQQWLKDNSYAKYPDSVMPQGSFDVTVDEGDTELYFADKPSLLQDLKNSVVTGTQNPSFQQIYDALKEKQYQLIKPYRQKGDTSEIDGASIELNETLLRSLQKIESQLRMFRLSDSGSGSFKKSANKAFVAKYESLKNSPEELMEWLRVNATDRKENGYPIPVHRYYSKYELLDDNDNIVPKENVPTFYWEMMVTEKETVNPEYNVFYEGKAVQYNKDIKQKYKNQKYFDLFAPDQNGNATRNKGLFEFREFLLGEKYSTMDKNMGKAYNNYFLLPQVRPYGSESLTSANKTISKLEDLFFVDGQDTDFNTKSKGKVESKTIPVHYVAKLGKNATTNDLGYMFFNYAQMSYNYQEKAKILLEVEILKDTIADSFTSTNTKGSNSRLYRATEEFISSNVYGNKYVDLGEFSTDKIPVIGRLVKGRTVSTTKLLNTSYASLVLKNLGLNIYVAPVGAVSATIQRRVMGSEGAFFTGTSINRADRMMKFGVSFLETIQDIGSVSPKTFLGKMDVFSGTRGLDVELAKGSFASNRLQRMLLQSNPLFDVVGYGVLGKLTSINTAMAVFDNFRLVDGNFISYRGFEEQQIANNGRMSKKEIDAAWATYQDMSYLDFLKETPNAIEVNREKLRTYGFNGNVSELQSRMEAVAQSAYQQVEGQANGYNKALSARNPLVKTLLWMHTSFFQGFVQARGKKRQFNYLLGTEEEGTYVSFARNFKKAITTLDFQEQMVMILGLFKSFEYHDKVMDKLELDQLEKANMRRVRADLYAYMGAFAGFALMNLLADDDDNEDDFLIQYLAYVSSRVFNETASVQLPFGALDTLKRFQSPTAGTALLESLITLPSQVLSSTDEVSSGAYEGMQKWQKNLIKATPFKNVIEPMVGSPRKSNMFFRAKTIPTFNEKIYKGISSSFYGEE